MSTRLSRSLIGLFLLAAIAIGFLVLGPSRHVPQAAGDLVVNGVYWASTDGLPPEWGPTLTAGQRIATADGQQLSITVGKNEIALSPNTVVLVGDSDPSTEIGTFKLASGRLDITVGKGETMTVDAPNLNIATRGARFTMKASEATSMIHVEGGAVTVLSPGPETEIRADYVAIVKAKSEPRLQIMTAAAAGEKPTVREGAAAAAQAWTLMEVRLEQVDPSLDPDTLPKPGMRIKPGVEISTMLGSEFWLERDTPNGRDVVQILPRSIVTVGDADPATELPDLAIVAGAMKVKADHTLFVDAPHLTATIEYGLAEVSTTPKASSVKTKWGTVNVASILTGEKRAVPKGVMQIVRAPNTPPMPVTPDMGQVEQMQ